MVKNNKKILTSAKVYLDERSRGGTGLPCFYKNPRRSGLRKFF